MIVISYRSSLMDKRVLNRKALNSCDHRRGGVMINIDQNKVGR